jgi:GTP-binding protein HflX
VGYTNAGKSTLFNALTKAQAYAADQLFATLDTTSRRVFLGEEAGHVVVSDTVGFIRELPHQLVAAFRATLEETIHADLLLHVVDASSAVRLDQIDQVNEVLRGIGADTIPQILVFNKIDAVPELAARGDAVERDEYGNISRVFLSARTGQGLDALRAAIAEITVAEAGVSGPEAGSVLSGQSELPDVTESAESTESTESTQSSSHDATALPEDHRPAEQHDEHDDRKIPEHGH